MSLQAFIEQISKGEVSVGSGGRIDAGRLADGYSVLTLDDPNSVTAECFNIGIFAPDEDWDEASSQVDQAIAAEQPKAIKALVKESVDWQGGYRTKPYSIHDFDPSFSRQERVAATASLMTEDDPEYSKDLEAANAYSPYVQWSRAVSDASHEYIQKGDSGLAGWLLARGAAPEYRLDYEPDSLRIDGQPVRTSADIAARAAKRLVDRVREAPERDTELYRGLHGDGPIKDLEKLQAGDTLSLNRLVSFSAHAKLALHFAERGKALNYEYVLKTSGPVKGLALDALADRDQGEVVTHGEFKVESVTKAEAGYVRASGFSYPVQRTTITLRQVRVY